MRVALEFHDTSALEPKATWRDHKMKAILRAGMPRTERAASE
jgi:hypothetical protein